MMRRPRIHPIALLTGALLLLFPTAGCRNESAKVVTIHFWNGFTGPDGRTMLRMVKRFNEQNPDVHVVMQRMDWATYYNKLFVAGLGHRAPEMFVVHMTSLERFARARFVRPVNDMMDGDAGVPTADIDRNIWQAGDIDGQHYGVPLDIHIMGMYYNRRMFREAGIVDERGEPRPPRTRDEFIDAARKMTKPGKWGFVFTNLESNAYCVMRQFDAPFFTPNADRCVMNDPRGAAGLQLCVDFIHKYNIAPRPQNFDAWIGFRQGNVGMAFEGIYMLADLEKQKDLDFAGAPVPQFGGHPAVWANSHNLCLRADLSPREVGACRRFIKFLSDNSLDWAEGGQVPVRISLREKPRFRAMKVQYAFASQIPIATYLPRVPFVFEFASEYDVAIEKALNGTIPPKQALDLATANTNKIIARDREIWGPERSAAR